MKNITKQNLQTIGNKRKDSGNEDLGNKCIYNFFISQFIKSYRKGNGSTFFDNKIKASCLRSNLNSNIEMHIRCI